MAIKAWVDRVIFAEFETASDGLAIFRMLFAAGFLIVLLPNYLWIASFPDSFFNPPWGLTSGFTGFPPPAFFVVLNLFLVAAAWCLFVGFNTRAASLTLATLLCIGNAWAYSFGKINHDIFLVLIPLALQFSGWGEAYSIDARLRGLSPHRSNAWPVALVALIVGLGMLSSALAKASSGWLSLDSQAVRGHILFNEVVYSRALFTSAFTRGFNNRVVWEALDYGTVLLEGAFLFAIGSRRAFRLVCAAATLFHVGIAVTMEIAYWPSLFAYGVFVDWSALARRLRLAGMFESVSQAFAGRPIRKLVLATVGTCAVYGLLYDLSRPEVSFAAGLMVCVLGAMIGTVHLTRELRSALDRSTARVEPPILLFDGVCGLCNRWVDLLLRYDRYGLLRFAPLQSAIGRALLERMQMPRTYIDSLVLIDGEKAYVRSAAVLRVCQLIGWPLKLLTVGFLIPRPVRDAVYSFVADHRFRWFGKLPACRIPTPAERSRFLS